MGTVTHGVVLTGPRVLLRPPRLDDADVLFTRITSDPDVTRYLSWLPHPDIVETRRVIGEMFNVGYEPSWLLEMRDSAEVVGVCGWRRPESHAAELGYCLARDWWGRRIMSEAVAVLIDALQSDPAVFRVWATCHVDNARSARLLQRNGLALEGRLARYGVFPNLSTEPQDCLLFAKALR
jgi:[ribosomal protein S5]-alanine N-acetyltransferase